VKKIASILALSGALVFGAAAACEKPPPREFYPLEIPDCDADDKVGKWDTVDCGPSPQPKRSTAAPKPSRRK
jgi:hypothetical protein